MKIFKFLIFAIFLPVTISAQVDVAIQKTLISQPPYQYGNTISFNVEIRNNSNIAVKNIVISDNIHCGFLYSGGTQIWSPSGNNRVTTYLGTINPGQSVNVGIDLTLIACINNNAWVNDVQIVSFTNAGGTDITNQDSNLTNNTSAVTAPVFDIALTKKMTTPIPYTYGDVLTFEIEVFNQGNQPIRNILIYDYLPVGTGYIYNAGLNPLWSGSQPTLNRSIAGPVLPGASTKIELKLILKRSIGGGRIYVNYAEIASAEDNFGDPIFDADSTPGSDTQAERDVLPGSPNDNNIMGGGASAGEDEDDHDPAGATVFDLAMTKSQGSALSSFSYLQEVEYNFIVYNQGSEAAKDIEITDYLPPALEYMNITKNILRGWSYNAVTKKAKSTITKVILPGQSDTIRLSLRPIQWYVDPNNAWTDYAEISSADDTDPNTLTKPIDLDSKPDDILGNDAGGLEDSPSDNAIDGDGTGLPKSPVASKDEDDQDPHKIQIFDLALDKKLITPGTYFQAGDNITFQITVYNQGNVPAKNIVVSDYVRGGFTFIPGGVNAGWSGSAPLIKHIFPGVLYPGQNITYQVTLQVKPSATPGAHLNYAEISAAQDTINNNRNDDADSVSDDNPLNDNQVLPGSADDNNIFGNSFQSEDEDDHDVAGIIFLCQKPTLTVGLPECNPLNGTYNITFYSNVTNISASSGTLVGSKITGILVGTDVTITANNGFNCSQSLTVLSPSSCPPTNGCTYPKLTVGQPLCTGNGFWSVSFTNDAGNVATNAGTVSGNTIINIPVNTDIIVTATNGNCVSKVSVTSPVNCGIPCANSPITISGPVCGPNGSGTYKINFIVAPGTTVIASTGTLGNGEVTGIPTGVSITLNVSTPGCDTRVIIVPAGDCPLCQRPTLTAGIPECNPSNGTYSITFYSNVANIITSTGNISGSKIADIQVGTDVTVTASNGLNCSQSLTVISPSSCPPTNGCTYPKLTVGQPLCTGNGFWSVSFTNDAGNVTTNAGTVTGNTIINIPVNTNIIVTATTGNCVSKVSVISPVNCGIPCANSPISISGPLCEPNGSGTYKINFMVAAGNTVSASTGTLGNGEVTGIPSGVNVTLTVTTPGCETRVIVIPAGLCVLPNGSIGKFVWHDLNGNGQQDLGEPGIPGVKVKLFNQAGNPIAQTTTAANGNYNFGDVPPGTYYIKFITPTGFSNTFANIGNDNTDSDVENSQGPGTTSLVTIVPGQNITTIDAGYYKCASVGSLVWYDINKNDIWDTNENGINGIRVNLWRNHFGTWLVWDYKYTGPKPGSPSDDGYFNFCAPPGQYYIEVIMPPLGLVRVLPNVGNNRNIDSDITNTFGPGTSNSFVLVSGGQKNDLGAGFYPMAVAGNLVWRDANNNGLQDPGEPKIQGVKIEAIEMVSRKVIATTYSDNEGLYNLDYLEKKQYYLKFYPPSGYLATIPRAGSDDKDSDVDHTFGPNTTRVFMMQPSIINENIDLGLAYSVLPVEWISVDVKKSDNAHILSWRTAKELNVSHYNVERKHDKDKEFVLLPVRHEPKGTSAQIHDYTMKDTDVNKTGTYVYRIKQVDFDGQFSYSPSVKIINNQQLEIDLYPNPAESETCLQIVMTQPAELKIEMFDINSSLIKIFRAVSLQYAPDETYKLNLEDVPPGVYNIVVSIDGKSFQKKLIKVD